eukprot:scaffold2877_cov41-Cyclotella_meneghiniana.AAC.1
MDFYQRRATGIGYPTGMVEEKWQVLQSAPLMMIPTPTLSRINHIMQSADGQRVRVVVVSEVTTYGVGYG